MKERPIIMQAESVRAILAGRKTQTRRIVTPQPAADWVPSPWPGDGAAWSDRRCPYGAPGDRLWVREAWAAGLDTDGDIVPDARHVIYREHNPTHEPWFVSSPGLHESWEVVGQTGWRSPLFMPRWASRLTLEVTGVRVERLWDISQVDALAEGYGCDECAVCNGTGDYDGAACWECDGEGRISSRAAFRAAWDRINGTRAPWASNPWVWVVAFRQVQP